MIRMPPPMPPRLAVSSHAVLPASTEVRSIIGPPTMPPIASSSTRRILSGRTIVSVDDAFHVAPAHRSAERPFGGEALEGRDLVFAAKRLARGSDDAGDAILPVTP